MVLIFILQILLSIFFCVYLPSYVFFGEKCLCRSFAFLLIVIFVFLDFFFNLSIFQYPPRHPDSFINFNWIMSFLFLKPTHTVPLSLSIRCKTMNMAGMIQLLHSHSSTPHALLLLPHRMYSNHTYFEFFKCSESSPIQRFGTPLFL